MKTKDTYEVTLYLTRPEALAMKDLTQSSLSPAESIEIRTVRSKIWNSLPTIQELASVPESADEPQVKDELERKDPRYDHYNS